MRHADLSEETLEPTPETVRLFGCPFDDCEKQSETMNGIRQHISVVHDPWYNRAIMECQHCGDHYPVLRSEISTSAFCNQDCKTAFGAGGGVSGSPTVVDPPIPVTITRETRYPCPIDDCDVICTNPFGFRKHATQAHNGRGRYTLTCERCGSPFHVKASEADRGRFCSPLCRDRSPKVRTKYRLLDLDPEDVGLTPIGETPNCKSDPFPANIPYATERPVGDSATGRSSDSSESRVHGGAIHDPESPWGQIAAAVVRLYLRGRTIVGARHIATELDEMSPQAVGWYLQNVSDHGDFWQALRDTYGLSIDTVEYNGGARTHYLRPVADEGVVAEDVPNWVAGRAETDTEPTDSEMKADMEASFAKCSMWRQKVGAGTPPSEIAANNDWSEEAITAHVEGSCEHGFKNEVAPVRNNGVEWVSTSFEADNQRSVPRKAPTFDG